MAHSYYQFWCINCWNKVCLEGRRLNFFSICCFVAMCTYDALCNNLRILKKRLQHLIIKEPTHFVIRGVVFYFPRENIQTIKKEWYFAGSIDQLFWAHLKYCITRQSRVTLWTSYYFDLELGKLGPRVHEVEAYQLTSEGKEKGFLFNWFFSKILIVQQKLSPKYALQTKNSSNQSAGVMRRMFDSLPLELRDSFLRANMNIISFAQFLETNKQKTYRFKLLWVNNKLTRKLK